MKLLIVFATVIGVTFATLDDDWGLWKSQYTKSYEDEATESVRRLVWEDNWRFVQQHNSEGHSFEVEMNEYADLTSEEFAKLFLSKINMANSTRGGEESPFTGKEALPSEVDWRQKGVVTPVKNQGQCGSCWSFSATGSLEGQHALKTGKLVSLSEQNLMDCSEREGDHSCEGGLMDNAFRYVIKNHGIDTEECYPYRAHDERRCEYKESCRAATCTGYVDVHRDNEDALQTAVANIGPISVAIDASHSSFQLYKRGVYDEMRCSSKKLDHGVLAVGYGEYESQAYWLVKNSWGERWGMEGYVMMSRNKDNQCGIATQASYPTGVGN
ncbi:procathepsin L-like [Dysidea avara]|uniref:procathepsin L-like n=1 Tax=Dysidea avara TaxID=196820 RepID=UPI003326176A